MKENKTTAEITEKGIKSTQYWSNRRYSIQTYINERETCLLTKNDTHPLKLNLNICSTAMKPVRILNVNTITLENQKSLTIIVTIIVTNKTIHF